MNRNTHLLFPKMLCQTTSAKCRLSCSAPDVLIHRLSTVISELIRMISLTERQWLLFCCDEHSYVCYRLAKYNIKIKNRSTLPLLSLFYNCYTRKWSDDPVHHMIVLCKFVTSASCWGNYDLPHCHSSMIWHGRLLSAIISRTHRPP